MDNGKYLDFAVSDLTIEERDYFMHYLAGAVSGPVKKIGGLWSIVRDGLSNDDALVPDYPTALL